MSYLEKNKKLLKNQRQKAPTMKRNFYNKRDNRLCAAGIRTLPY